MGSATAWHLSDNDASLLLLEKQDSIYDQGSSKGEARIARSSNRGNDLWSYLHNRSVQETKKLIDFLNDRTGEQDHHIHEIYRTSPVTYVGQKKIYEKLLASLIRQKVSYEIAQNPSEARKKFAVELGDGLLIQREYNAHSGTMNPSKLIDYLHEAIKKKGAHIHYNCTVRSIRKVDGIYHLSVKIKDNPAPQSLKAHKIICAAGPYTGTLLKDVAPYFQDLISPKRVFLTFLQIRQSHYEGLGGLKQKQLLDGYPVINSAAGTRDGSFFSMIEYFDKNNHPVFKIGGHFQRSEIGDLDVVWQQPLTPEEKKWSMDNTLAYLDLLGIPMTADHLQVVDGYSCVYSLTKSEVPLVTPLRTTDGKKDGSMVVLAGMSGVGAKGAMTYGLIAANLLSGRTEDDAQYVDAVTALGYDRLVSDLAASNEKVE